MTHDEKCELPKDFAKLLPEDMVLAHIFGEGCSCADRAIAKARREVIEKILAYARLHMDDNEEKGLRWFISHELPEDKP